MTVLDIVLIVIAVAALINRLGSLVLQVLMWRQYHRLYPAVGFIRWLSYRKRNRRCR